MRLSPLRRGALVLACLAGCLQFASPFSWAQTAALRPPAPVDAVAAMLDALRTHPVVALGLTHGDPRGLAFVVSLLRNPLFPTLVNDVVLEGASGRYQDVMDRYVRGEAIPDAVIRHVWDDTTQPQFPGPIWTGQPPEIYRTVREVNQAVTRDRQIRILLSDPPIDWDSVRTPAEYMKWLEQRDTYPAELIRREVVARKRRTLIVYGGGHLQRRNQAANYQVDNPLAQTIVSLLEANGVSVFVARTTDDSRLPGDEMKTWPVPSLALLRGTTLGSRDEPAGSMPRMAVRDGRLEPIPREQWAAIPLETQMDAVLYLGPPSAKTTDAVAAENSVLHDAIPRTVCSDKAYIQTRLKRMALAGLPRSEMERLQHFCGLETPK